MSSSSRYLLSVPSPIGRIELTGDGEAVTSLSIARGGILPHGERPEYTSAVLDDAAEQLAQYFAGDRRDFDLPLRLEGTPFRRAVWERLAGLGFGTLTTYGELGLALGHSGYGRAVGGAVGANPVPIIVGCHRVLSSSGKVTGYSGGEGIPTKLWLLEHEGMTLAT
ncbi:cysteine methyltransferase [Leifsonia xyli subsp. xyli]|uniref:methylated-DNA--[protein]-cysteine S-methyltransferase n=2 Tax=Leifsonia xyli subsp. xyli TaxID=59736 RepID=Q6AG53_LEIXX|nr:methylated-DNA--[protein]-cysteine S-methyltransferase [Leifsonia xyli]AAT88642.1 methylated-DNA-protein-cysteine S-methyltransferase [Leifsonia xyli subsp. xyli str. CTCB07]ODA90793.1 cysteine methyltransferase [Leifsonia xyli subsp. xyli]